MVELEGQDLIDSWNLCAYCRKERAVHKDHIMSKSDRRRHEGWDDETVDSCAACNWRKLSRHLVPRGYPRLAELNELTPNRPWEEWDGSVEGLREVLR